MSENSQKELEKKLKKLEEEIKQLKSCKRYGLVWEDKPEDVVEQCKKELPVLEEVASRAIVKDDTKPTNLLIEGDNYHALSVLNYTHKGKIDVIYIDPPYNTGNKDFIYNDRYVDKEDTFRHSKWLSFMEKRLKLARSLLKKGGLIFINIDDHEHAQLKMLCDEIFSEANFLANIIWQKKYTQSNDAKFFSPTHDFILCYTKNVEYAKIKLLARTERQNNRYKNPDNDPRGLWMTQPLHAKSGKDSSYTYEFRNGVQWSPPAGTFPRYSKNSLKRADAEGRIWFGAKGTAVPRLKKYLEEMKNGVIPKTIWLYDEVGSNDDGRKELKSLIPQNIFSSPKPTALIKHIINLSIEKKGVILDFMAGSGTTGHAVLELNKEDDGDRQFILCTNNESKIAEDVCYPRVKKVIEGYGDVEGISANMRYFKTAFVPQSDVSDDTRKKLVRKSTDMICVKESAYDKKYDNKDYKIYVNKQYSVGILFNLDKIGDFKEKLQKVGLESHVYVFSLSNDTFDSDFDDLSIAHSLVPIPESILEVYRKLFG